MEINKLNVLGIMSGSSLDGIDLALFTIDSKDLSDISWSLLKANTVAIPDPLSTKLKNSNQLHAADYFALENDYTDFIIEEIRTFLSNAEACNLIGIHGHTVAHNPEAGYSIQMGNTGKICETLKTHCVSDFRNQDIAAGGQGAPMAPLVDHLLFPEYDSWINLGGIVNVSLKDSAYDIGPFNQFSNYMAEKKGMRYDKNGDLGKNGKYIAELDKKFLEFPFYRRSGRKSLSNEELREYFMTLIEDSAYSVEDILHTFYNHIADKISESLKGTKRCLLSGGGAYNNYFTEHLRKLNPDITIDIPEADIIDYKEALLIALAAQLRYLKKPNYIQGITAADRTVSAGALYIHSGDDDK